MTFDGWSWFYAVTGESAAALIGLLFIVTTISPPQTDANVSSMGTRLFTTPTVAALALVLVISALALAPGSETGSACLLMTAAAATALLYAAKISVRLFRIQDKTHWSDPWFYGAAPVAVYVALAVSAISAWRRAPHAAYALGLVLLVLLMLAIRNAWDLVTWLAARRNAPPAPPPA